MPRKLTNKEFIEKSKKIHGNKYEYSLVNYISSKNKIKIICPKHGIFEQTPNSHLNGHGCQICGLNIKEYNNKWENYKHLVKLNTRKIKNKL